MVHARSFRTFLSLATAACVMGAASTYSNFTFRLSLSCTFVRDTVLDFVRVALAKFERPALRLAGRLVAPLQACAYVVGLAKRQRPRLTPGWRMCPST